MRRSARAGAIAGMEHWLPLFYERLDTLFDYLPATRRSCSTTWRDEAVAERLALIADDYEAREAALTPSMPRRRALQAAAARRGSI